MIYQQTAVKNVYLRENILVMMIGKIMLRFSTYTIINVGNKNKYRDGPLSSFPMIDRYLFCKNTYVIEVSIQIFRVNTGTEKIFYDLFIIQTIPTFSRRPSS